MDIQNLYKLPFRLCAVGVFVLDADNEVAFDFSHDGFRVRGLGRMSYFSNGAELFDAVETRIREILPPGAFEPHEHLERNQKQQLVDLLNGKW
jgi:hypothetical protein